MSTEQRVRRSGAHTTAELLSAALDVMAELGLDATSLPAIAKRANVSTGPLYNRFDGTDDVVLAVWPTTIAPAFRLITEQLADWLTGDGSAPPPALCATLRQPEPAVEALVETMSAVRRFPYATDIIRDDCAAIVQRYTLRTASIPPALSQYALAAVLGEMLIARVTPPRRRSSPQQFLQTVRDLSRATAPLVGRADDFEPLQMPVITSDSATTDDFLNAALVVIARGGFDRASAHRIARQAGHSVSHSYSHFSSKHKLAAAALGAIIDQVVGPRVLAFIGIDEAAAQRLVLMASRALCDDSTRQVRRLRLECVLAARHYDDLHTTFADALDRADSMVAARLSSELGVTPAQLQRLTGQWHMIRAFTFGALALDEAAGILSPELDSRPLATAIPRLFAEYARSSP